VGAAVKATRPSELRAALTERGIRPSRALGQNFLIDANLVRIIADAAGLASDERVLEIGPGAGALTEALLARAGGVLAVEKDHRLAAWLRERYAEEPRLELIEGDALAVGMVALLARGCAALVSNLPYSSGTRMLVDAMHAPDRPARMVVTVQTEVADRLRATPGSPAHGLLSIWAARLYEIEVVRRVPASCFWPAPEVESTVVRLRLRARPLAEPDSLPRFIAVTRVLMSHRRKQLRRALREWRPGPRPEIAADEPGWIERLGLDPTARPETLTVEDWVRLADALADAPAEPGGV
jgi:16S rRNA (adenine1518-N6/adenine1519-N6)-dimethyltransferase